MSADRVKAPTARSSSLNTDDDERPYWQRHGVLAAKLAGYSTGPVKMSAMNSQALRILFMELGKGNSVTVACKRAGFSTATLYKKTQEALAEDPPNIEMAIYWRLWRMAGKLEPDMPYEVKAKWVEESYQQIAKDTHAALNPEPPSNVIELDHQRK
jgi:hypothetical protein